MMTNDDRDYVEQALTNLLQGQAALRVTAVAFLPPYLQQRVPDNLLPPMLARLVIELCIEDAYANSPPTLIKLVTGLVGADPRIATIMTRAAVPPPAGPDPYAASILRNGMPFLGRTALRAHTKTLAGPGRVRPVVIVNGIINSGKSYSGDFLDHICGLQPGVRFSRNVLKEKQGHATGAAELARDLMTDVGGDPASLPPRAVNVDADTSNLDRWTVELANGVIAQANRSNSRWWFILDGYNKTELREDTKFFIVNFVLRLQAGVAMQHRLILIDFDRTLLAIPPGLIAPDITETIPHGLVQGFVQEMTALRATPLDWQQLSSGVLDGLPDPVVDLTMLGDRLNNLVLSLETVP